VTDKLAGGFPKSIESYTPKRFMPMMALCIENKDRENNLETMILRTRRACQSIKRYIHFKVVFFRKGTINISQTSDTLYLQTENFRRNFLSLHFCDLKR